MQQIRTAVEHALDVAEIGGALAFDHVTGERVRAAGEADQRYRIVQGPANFADGIHDIAEMIVGIGSAQVVDGPFLA